MAEDIQADVATEQVQPEATQVTFGQGENTDTSSNDNGQVESESINNSWEVDKRFESHWGKDPNKMYESLRYHEKRQGDFDKQINDYKSQVEELQKYKDDYTALEDLFNHPQIGPDIENVLNKHHNGNQDQEQPQASVQDDRLDEVLAWKQSVEQQALSHYETQQQNKAFDSINEYAKSQNIQWNKDEFVNYMQANNFPVETWPIAFKGVASEQIMANQRSKAAEQALSKAQATQSVVTGNNKVPVTSKAPSNIFDLRAQLDEVIPG